MGNQSSYIWRDHEYTSNGVKEEKIILGYRNGYEYIQVGNDIYRGDYADVHGLYRWYSTVAGMTASIKAFGKLSDENGNEII